MRFVVICMLLPLLGCESNQSVSKHQAAPPSSANQSTDQPGGADRDNEKEAVAALEVYGAKCTTDGSGNVFAVALDQTDITDEGLVHLKSLPKLKELSLYGTPVTDVGLEHLKVLTSLEKLNLEYTKTSPEAREALQRSLPNCEIYP